MGLSSDPEKRARQEAALRKGNPKAFTKTPAGGGAGKPTKSRPKAAKVSAGAPPAHPKARREPAEPGKRSPRPKRSSAGAGKGDKRGSGGGFFRGLLDI